MFHDGHLLLILHDLPAVPGSGVQQRKGLFFWRNPEGQWRSSYGAGFARLTQLVDQYERRIDELEEHLTAADDAATLFDVLRQGSPLRRAAQSFARALQQAREAVGGRDMIALRDRAQEMVTASDVVVVDAKHALDYVMARQAEAQSKADRQQAENSTRLNRLAAFFLPLTLLASLFSMKLPSGLETEHPLGFWAVVAGGLAIGYLVGRFGGPGSDEQKPSSTVSGDTVRIAGAS